jgi:T5SS/PEP-CTERM-associated repeat protein/autotransporter-associated beta strand protein
VYRVVFNHALKCVQVVSEFARGGRSSAGTDRRRAPRLAPLFTGIALACMAPAALAINSIWIGPPGSEWNVGSSWINGVPIDRGIDTPNDTAYVNSGGVRITGTLVPDADEVHIGNTGAGRLDIFAGGRLDTNTLYMGTEVGSLGVATINGVGSQWNARYSIGVGHYGTGELSILNGGSMTIDRESYIASMGGSTGLVRIVGAGSTWNTGDTLYAGQAGTGTVEVTAGGLLNARGTLVGNLFGSVGQVTVSGTGSHWENAGLLYIGQLGKGTVTVSDGATVETHGLTILGNQALSASNRSRGDLIVTGSGSTFNTSSGAIMVGNAGVGAIEIRDGGAGQFGGVTFGQTSSGVGTALITDAGSTWESGSLVLGMNGYGRFDLRDGATATVRGNISLGEGNFGAGYLLVGTDATLDMTSATPATITTGSNGTGWVELNGGTLRASTALRVDSAVQIGADSVLDARQAVLVRGTISGSGRLRKDGGGTLNLANVDNSAWTGGLQVDNGTVWAAGSQSLGRGWLGMADGTSLGLFDGVNLTNAVQMLGDVTVMVASGESATLSGGVSGDATTQLIKRDAGTLTLGGGTVGLTRVEAGTLRVTGNALNGGNVEIGSAGTFAIDTTRVLQYAGQFSGGGTLRQGRHFLTLTGDSSAFTGNTVVDGGMLAVEGALGGQLQMTNNALLAGNGSLGSVQLLGGSVLSPGSRVAGSIGRLSISGDLLFDASATFQVDVAANGSSDYVGVGGKATLGNAGTVAVAAAGDWAPSTRYTLMTADAGVVGTFAGVTSNLAFLDPALSYDANHVYLTMARNDIALPEVELAFPEVVLNTNQKQVAGAVEALGDGNAVYDAVVRLEVPQVVPAFDSLSGEVHAATRGALLQNRFLHDGIDRHLDGRAMSGDIAPGVSVWLAGSGGQLRTDASAENAASRVQQQGLMAGAGWQVGEALELGVAAGQQQLDNRLRERAAVAETDATEYGVYAHYRWQGLSLRGGVTRADYRTDTTRTAQIGTAFSEQLLAREDATGTTAFVRAGWSFGGPRLQLTPEIELAQVRLKSDGSQERGGDSALRLASGDSDYRTGLAALKADWDISGGLQDRAVLSARVGWQYADGDRLPTTTARFVGGSQDFTIAGAPLARSSVLAQLGVAVSPSANSRVSLQVQGRDGDGQRDVGAQLDWSVAF